MDALQFILSLTQAPVAVDPNHTEPAPAPASTPTPADHYPDETHTAPDTADKPKRVDPNYTQDEVHARFEQARQLHAGAVKKAATRYLAGDDLRRRIGIEDMQQECWMLLLECCEKFADPVDSEAFYAKLSSMLWKRVGRIIQTEKAQKRNFKADVLGEAATFAFNGVLAHAEYVGEGEEDEDEDEGEGDTVSLLDSFGAMPVDQRTEIANLLQTIIAQLTPYQTQLLTDLIDPPEEIKQWTEEVAITRTKRGSVNMQSGMWPIMWIKAYHIEVLGVKPWTFEKERMQIQEIAHSLDLAALTEDHTDSMDMPSMSTKAEKEYGRFGSDDTEVRRRVRPQHLFNP